jgi:hypothetical protein
MARSPPRAEPLVDEEAERGAEGGAMRGAASDQSGHDRRSYMLIVGDKKIFWLIL